MSVRSQNWSGRAWSFWLWFMIFLSFSYTISFVFSSLWSNDTSNPEGSRNTWEIVLFFTNAIFCIAVLFHLFIYDRKERAALNPVLSRAVSLMLAVAPLACAIFDPFKKFLLKMNYENHDGYAATGAICLMILLFIAKMAVDKFKK